MKTDNSFKLVAALILAGVVIALVSNTRAAKPNTKCTPTETFTVSTIETPKS